MVQNYRYRSPATPGSAGFNVDLGNQAVRLGNISGITQEAELGAVGTSSIAIDDLTGTAGHDSDAILGLKQFDWIESAAGSGNRRIWTGYIGDRTYRRGTGSESPSLRTGPARVIDITLVDINAFLGFRLLGVDSTSAFNRPAETDVARVTALLAVDFLSDTLFDGLVSTANPVDMDAVDYTGQRPSDVLNDCAQQSGKNFFAFYDEAGTYTPDPGDFGLFYDSNNSLVYPANDPDLKVSNVLADVNVTANEPTGPVWEPLIDAQLVRDPSRVIAGAFFQNGSNSVYVTNATTSYTYGWRDATGNSQNLKTRAQTVARGGRYLLENATEDDRITFTLKLPAANVNDWQVGQYAPVKFSHLPGYESTYKNVRCLTRTTMQDELTDEFYDVRYEVTPMVPSPTGGFGFWEPGYPTYARPVLPSETVPGDLLFMVMATQNIFSGVHIPATPTFTDDPTGSPTAGAWTTVGFVHAAGAGSPDTYVAYGIFARYVGVAETTTIPVEVQPDPTNVKCGVYLWDVPGGTIPTSAATLSSDTTGRFAEGQTISLGGSLTGLVVGGFAFQAGSAGHRATVTPTAGTTILLANALNGSAAPVASPSGNEPPEIWIGSTTGGPLAASFTFPYDTFNDQAVAAVVCTIPGITSPLPHINGYDETPPNVTP